MNNSTLRLRNNLLRYGHDVVRTKLDSRIADCTQQALRQIRAGLYFRHAADRNKLKLHCRCCRYLQVSLSVRGLSRKARRSSGVSISKAIPGRSMTSERRPAAAAFDR